MDDARFDAVVRALAHPFRRRAVAGALAAIVMERTAGLAASRRKRCLRDNRRCGPDSGRSGGPCAECCSGFARYTSASLRPTGKRRCAGRPEGMACTQSSQCQNAVCHPATSTCAAGLLASPPIACEVSQPFCSPITPPNCGSTTKCWCATTNSGENLCTNGSFSCASNFGPNVTCNSDNDCFNFYGETTACVSLQACGASVACSGGTACAHACGT